MGLWPGAKGERHKFLKKRSWSMCREGGSPSNFSHSCSIAGSKNKTGKIAGLSWWICPSDKPEISLCVVLQEL
jgi:hypothetical protein